MRTPKLTSLIASFAAAAALAACSSEETKPTPKTPMTAVEESWLTARGWSVCFSDTYADWGMPLADILAACDGADLLLACRPVGETAFTLAAWAPRGVATTDTGTDANTTTSTSGAQWYYNGDWSWGFAPLGVTVNKDSCDFPMDQPQAELRLCWHTGSSSIDDGYRCGTNQLNGNGNWERVIMHR